LLPYLKIIHLYLIQSADTPLCKNTSHIKKPQSILPNHLITASCGLSFWWYYGFYQYSFYQYGVYQYL